MPKLALDVDIPLVPEDHAIDHSEPEPRVLLMLDGKERFHATRLHFLAHAHAVIRHRQTQPAAARFRANRDRSPLGNRLDGIEDEIDQHLAQFAFIRGHGGHIAEFRPDVDLYSGAQRLILPSRLRQRDGFLNDLVDGNGRECFGLIPVAIKLLETACDLAGVLGGGMDHLQIGSNFLGLIEQIGFVEQ